MVIITNTQYEIKKYKDTYSIENISSSSIDVTISELNCGTPIRTITTFILTPGAIRTFIPKYDGTFGVFIGDNSTPSTIINGFDNVLESIISYTEQFLCGCDCANCNDCNEEASDCDIKIRLISTILGYFIATNPKYIKYFNIVANKLKCEISSDLFCQITNLNFTGKSDNEFFLKRLVAYFYLVFYIEASLQSTDQEEAEYIKEKFNYAVIRKCIKKLGINPEDIVEELMSGIKVRYWQFTSTVPDMDTVIGLWTPTYLNGLPGIDERPLEEFEQGVTIPYTNVGRVGFAVQPSQLLNYTILDSLGNDVTDNFDTHYFEDEETVVFVSKLPYSHSNIYFKFKRNIYV